MKAIIQTDLSNPRALEWTDVLGSTLKDGQVLVKVKVAGVNRADPLQAAGHYPPPKGVIDTFGLRCVGIVEEVEGDSQGWKVGDEVCYPPSGGIYAEKVAAPAGQALPLSHSYFFIEAIPIVEVAYTVFSSVVMIAGLKEGDLLLAHGSAGDTGAFAIQVAKRLGARVAVTAGSAEKLVRCKGLGAGILVNYKEEGLTEIVAAEGGANAILNIMDAKYLDRNVKALAEDSHLVITGTQGGVKGEPNIGRLLNKCGSITATDLHYRDLTDKACVVNVTEDTVWPMLADGAVTPQVHEVMDTCDAVKVHELLDSGAISDKIVLTV